MGHTWHAAVVSVGRDGPTLGDPALCPECSATGMRSLGERKAITAADCENLISAEEVGIFGKRAMFAIGFTVAMILGRVVVEGNDEAPWKSTIDNIADHAADHRHQVALALHRAHPDFVECADFPALLKFAFGHDSLLRSHEFEWRLGKKVRERLKESDADTQSR